MVDSVRSVTGRKRSESREIVVESGNVAGDDRSHDGGWGWTQIEGLSKGKLSKWSASLDVAQQHRKCLESRSGGESLANKTMVQAVIAAAEVGGGSRSTANHEVVMVVPVLWQRLASDNPKWQWC